MDESPFKNCSGYSRRELLGTAAASSSSAVFCCFYLFVLCAIIVTIKKRKVYESVLKRLTVWLTAVTFAFLLLLALNFTSHIDYNFFYRNPILCQLYGFTIQYSWSVQLLFMFGISLLLFFKILEASPWKPACTSALQEKIKGGTFMYRGRTISKEHSLLIAVFVIPLFFDLIPFTTNSYGHFGPFCWIRDTETDCSKHIPGRVEQFILLIVPFGFLAVLTFGLTAMSLYLLCSAIKNARVKKKKRNQAVRIIVSLLTNLGCIFGACVFIMIALSVLPENNTFFLWTTAAISASGLCIPLGLLLPIQCANIARACCKHKRQTRRDHRPGESEAATAHKSELNTLPSHTTWDPLHSSGEDSQHNYSMYEDN